jgi:hypothetical protein
MKRMSFTTEEAVRAEKEITNELFNDIAGVKRAQQHNDDLLQYQAELTAVHASIVTPQEIKECSSNTIDIETLKSDMGDQFYNYDVMKALGCVVSSVFYGIIEEHGNLAHIANLKSQVKNLTKIGGPSVSGNASIGGIGNAKDLYVVKTPQRESGNADLTHELFVGLFGINKLRRYIPNFAMIYGGAKYTAPIITGKVVTLPTQGSGNKVQYTIYENVGNAKALNKYIQTASVKDTLSVYSQELYALDFAARMIGFTHYDAHTENKLERAVPKYKNFSIPYPDPLTGNTVYISANAVSTSIDYGMSSITYKGVDYGIDDYKMIKFGVQAGSNPLFDAYKLLMFMGFDLYTAGKAKGRVMAELAKIFTYFNDQEDYTECVVVQRELYYCFIPTQSNADMTLRGLIRHMHKVCNLSDIITDKPLYPVLECGSSGNHGDNKCFTFEGEIKHAQSYKTSPSSLLEFYDVASTLKQSDRETYQKLVNSFDYTSNKKKFMQLVSEEIAHIKAHLSSEDLKSIPTFKPRVSENELKSTDLTDRLSAGLNQVIAAVSAYESLDLWLKVGENVGTVFQDQDMQEYVRSQREQLQKLNGTLMKAIDLFRNNYRTITKLIESETWVAKHHEKYPWYRDSGATIVGLVNRFRKDEKDLFNPLMLPSVMINQQPASQVKNTMSVLPIQRNTKLVRSTTGTPLRIESTM